MPHQLANSEVSPEVLQRISKKIDEPENASPQQQWQAVCEVARETKLEPDTLRALWDQYCGDEDLPGRPLWWPDTETLQQANLSRWMRDLNISSYPEFHRWSAENRGDFWKKSIDELNIVFSQAADQILDESGGAENARWLPAARLNIVNSCFGAGAESVAIVYQKPGESIKQWTVGELRRTVNRVANGLVEAGLKPGDSIGVVLPMTAESVAIYLGIVNAGCAVVSIADSFAAPEIANRLQIANADAVFTYDQVIRGGKSIPLFQRVAEATDIPIITLPCTGQLTVQLRTQDLPWSEFVSKNDRFEPVIAGGYDAINILFSSGTTGDPKAIPWTQLTPIKCAIDGLLHQDIHPGHVVAWPTNLGWMMGPWLIFATLINRATIALYEDMPIGEGFGQFVQDARVNILGVVPTIVKSWRKSRSMEPFDWSHIHCYSSTGEASGAEDMFYLSALAGIKPIIEYCGGTEIGGGYITSTMTQPNVPAAFTTPAVGLDFVLLDESGQLSDEGELFLVPPSVGLSQRLLNRDHHQTYFADVPAGPDGQVLRRHGDHMKRLASGVWIAGGRVDDTMNLGGIKISSAEIERVVNLIDGVKETAAVAFSDDQGPEQLAIFTVGDSELDAADLKIQMNRRIKEQLNPLFKVERVALIEQLPRTASGKVMRRKLRDQL